MREPTTEANNPIEQEFLSVIREYERVIYKVCYLYTHPNAPLNDLYQDVVLNLWKAYPSNPQLSSSASFLRLNVLSSLN